uniref:Serine/threonine-protein kinase ATM n=1 Tax=Rhizophora mucronata TaxID=61149 RepID=A0A2P2L2S6_RHIMU
MEDSYVSVGFNAICRSGFNSHSAIFFLPFMKIFYYRQLLVHGCLILMSFNLTASPFQYLDELRGPILFFWVSCGVSLVALVEIRQLLLSDAEPSYFIQYCCPWLLPALILNSDNSNLNWVAQVACHPLAVLIKNHFVPIFSLCMGWHCSKRCDWERGGLVLQTSILHLAEIAENERDELIKKHMVSIVSYILALASSVSDPPVPLFTKDVVAHAIQTVVDGFLEKEDYAASGVVLDKINIFRPDRVFMFILEMHYQIAAAVHPRHRCHRLAGVEVLINILGPRASVSSTFNYLCNLTGQFIGCQALQDQCCCIISALLQTFKSKPSKVIAILLGEQLQFLVSKLVASCIAVDTAGKLSSIRSSEVLSLLHQLTVDSDPALQDYVRELEPFPQIGIFDGIREFHQELWHACSPRDHLLKFAKRSCFLPPRLLSCSVQALHKQLMSRESFWKGNKAARDTIEDAYWYHDAEIVDAVWTLVRMCGSDDANSIRPLVSDFVSRVPSFDIFRLSRCLNFFSA